jgi:hypothetical protein
VILDTGLTLSIERIEFSNTYAGCLEDSNEIATGYLIEQLNRLAEDMQRSGEHFYCLNMDEQMPLPAISCLAPIKSNDGVG